MKVVLIELATANLATKRHLNLQIVDLHSLFHLLFISRQRLPPWRSSGTKSDLFMGILQSQLSKREHLTEFHARQWLSSHEPCLVQNGNSIHTLGEPRASGPRAPTHSSWCAVTCCSTQLWHWQSCYAHFKSLHRLSSSLQVWFPCWRRLTCPLVFFLPPRLLR